MQKGRRDNAATPLRRTVTRALPEEVADHVDHFASVGVDQHRVVPITDPHRSGRRIGQAVFPRVADPVAVAVIARPQPPTDLIRPVVPAERIVIEAEVEQRTVVTPVVLPVEPAVVAPAGVPRARMTRAPALRAER